ncbi:outer membrane protein insertion porin family [Cetobacterium ceti]|uniref:Outer membrane protein insertion porin family n=1 Tax=Cetobacterium ceti TaxID=180163 RepID=A0A1T4JY41_9FUSO|nr:outer membrane protein assembly factor [Cetobacterium ceti]SJZ34935.1 outer membrane protein insertion porin family [Cetobacterium ceti]
MKKYLVSLLVFVMSLVSYGATTGYLVKAIDVVNTREIPTEVILGKMTSKVGQNFSTENLLKDYNGIKKADYVENVTIYPKVYDGGIKLTVEIQEKPDAKKLLEKEGIIPLSEREKVDTSLVVSSVEVVGNTYIPMSELSEKIPVKVGAYFSKNKIVEGQRNLLETGYFRSVEPEVYNYPSGVVVVYNLIENPVITGVNIIGNTIYSTDELMKLIKTQPGKVLNINTLRQDKDAILGKYNENGYVLAEIVDIGLNQGNQLEIILNEGVIRDVKFQKMVTKQKGGRRKATDNQLKTRDYVIAREVEVKPDQVFNINAYDETVKNLMRLGYFKNVKYEVKDIPGDPDGKELVLLLDEDRTATLQGAISYGSEVGLLGMLSIKDINWQGRGQDLGFTFEKSDRDYTSFSIDFYDPWIRGTDRISWGWSAYKTEYENDDSVLFNKIDTYGAKLTVGKGLSKYLRFNVGTKLEHVTEERNDDSQWANFLKENGYGKKADYMLWSIYPSLVYDSRNNYWNPTAGDYAKYQVEMGYASGEYSEGFANTTLELRKYHRGFFKKNTFAYRAVFGIMTDSTPESQRFWVGGGSTLRGYDSGYFQGTQKVVGTIENRTQINDILGFVVFSDFGRAWDYRGKDPGYLSENRDAQFPTGIATTAGVGLRLNTPIGPLRFDFGWPVGGDRDESGMKFYFNMGQSF